MKMGELYYDELGMKTDECKTYQIPVPLGIDCGILVQHKFPMKREEYEFMMRILDIWQQGFVTD